MIKTATPTAAIGVERDHILDKCCCTVAVGCHSTLLKAEAMGVLKKHNECTVGVLAM